MASQRTSFLFGAIATVCLGAIVAIALWFREEVSPPALVAALGMEAQATPRTATPELEAPAAVPQQSAVARTEVPVVTPPVEVGKAFDFTDLAPLRARLIDEKSSEPLYRTLCSVTDRNGVTVEATTDADGYLSSEELLLKGQVALQYRHPEGLLFSPVQGPYFADVDARLQHSGAQGRPDLWKASFSRYVGLIALGELVPDGTVYVTLLSGSGAKTSVEVGRLSGTAYPPTAGRGPKRSRILVFRPGDKPGDVTFGDWSKANIGARAPRRLVRAVTIQANTIYQAETEVPEVPHWQDELVPLRFAPMGRIELKDIERRYSQATALAIRAHLDSLKLPYQPEATRLSMISGVVTSATGAYHGKTRVLARPTTLQVLGQSPFPRGDALVDWTEGADGRWVGQFELSGLAPTVYSVEFRPAADAYVLPSRHEVPAPYEFHKGTVEVLDNVEAALVQVSIPERETTGYSATLEFQYGGHALKSELIVARQPADRPDIPRFNAPYAFGLRVPVGTEFKVTVTGRGRDPKTFPSTDFKLVDGAWLGILSPD